LIISRITEGLINFYHTLEMKLLAYLFYSQEHSQVPAGKEFDLHFRILTPIT
jgi:hypothetical protein